MSDVGGLDEAAAAELASGSNRGNPFTPRTAGYEGLSFRTKKLRFKTGKYDQEVLIPDIKVVSKMKGTDEEKIRIALDGDVKVHCTCPDFRYGGFQYLGTQLGFSSKPLDIPAPVRNPGDEGTVCKHLRFLLSRIDDYVDDVAADFDRARDTKWYSTVRRTVESGVPTFEEFVAEAADPDRAAYLKWKRANVSLRGMAEVGRDNGGGARMGVGLYTAALSNAKMARGFGRLHFVVNGVPRRPKVFRDMGQWETFYYAELVRKKYKSVAEFNAHTTVERAMQELGFDGVVVTGREMVNYAPPDDLMYFQDEWGVRDYWERAVKGK